MTSYRDESVRPGHALRLCRGRGRSGRREHQPAIEPRRRDGAAVAQANRPNGRTGDQGADGSHLSNQAGQRRTIRRRARRAVALAEGRLSSATTTSGEAVPAGSHRFLAPVTPSIVVCIGLNYKDHAAEMNKKLPAEPLVFLKPQSSVIGPEDEIRIPSWAGRIEHEAEMAVVIGKRASNVKAADAMSLRARHHVPQRRDRARAAGEGRAVFARQGLRHVLADRSVHCRRPRSVRAGRRRLGQRRAPPPLQHARADLPGAVSRRARHALHDAQSRRRDHDRHAVGRRAADAGRSHDGEGRRASARSVATPVSPT